MDCNAMVHQPRTLEKFYAISIEGILIMNAHWIQGSPYTSAVQHITFQVQKFI